MRLDILSWAWPRADRPDGGLCPHAEEVALPLLLSPVERGFYRASGIDAEQVQGWAAYALAMLTFNAAALAHFCGCKAFCP